MLDLDPTDGPGSPGPPCTGSVSAMLELPAVARIPTRLHPFIYPPTSVRVEICENMFRFKSDIFFVCEMNKKVRFCARPEGGVKTICGPTEDLYVIRKWSRRVWQVGGGPGGRG